MEALDTISTVYYRDSALKYIEIVRLLGSIHKKLWILDRNGFRNLDNARYYYDFAFNKERSFYDKFNTIVCDFLFTYYKKYKEANCEKDSLVEQTYNLLNYLLDIEKEESFLQRDNIKCIYACIAHCNLMLGDYQKNTLYELLFMQQNPNARELNTYTEFKDLILSAI